MSDSERPKKEPSNILYQKPEITKVLLIEDNPGDVRLVKEMLVDAGANKFSLTHVGLLREGLSLLGEEGYHLILLDLSLPDGHGLGTIKQVCGAVPYLPVVILTGLDDETVAIRAVQEGAQDYLVKGQMDSNLLTRAIRYAIERKRAAEKLRESEERFRQLAENIREVFYIYEIPEPNITRFLYVSPAYKEVWGRPCEGLYQDSKSFLDAVYPPDKDRVISSSMKRRQGEVEDQYRIQRPDGSILWIKDRSFPVFDGSGKAYRIVGIAANITDQKLGEEKLRYLSLHDTLTGLYNRVYFEEELRRIEKMRYKTVGIISCDLDGLKLVNDTLGHDRGDILIIGVAKVMRECFREGDMVARIGGDEFSVILPNASRAILESSCQRIREALARYNVDHPELPLNISLGFAVNNGESVNMKDLLKEADSNMYREKLYRKQSIRRSITQTLVKTLKEKDVLTEEHVDRLEKLLTDLAVLAGLPESTITDLRLLAKFHDIGNVGVSDQILLKKGPLTPEEWTEMQRHSEVGFRIALSAPELNPIADWILKHHEWWNGQGYPFGLKGKEIPIECRLLAIVDAYAALTSVRPYRKTFSPEEAMAELRNRSGSQFDPELLKKFIQMLERHLSDSKPTTIDPV
jgi:diguanylate cyclase (GGDEF)-like protein/PAS domain S-box-containing protein